MTSLLKYSVMFGDLLSLELSSGPSHEPVTAEDCKKQIEVEPTVTAHDSWIDDQIPAARRTVENMCGRALLTQEWTARYSYGNAFRLWRPPFRDLVSISTFYEGTETAEDTDDFWIQSGLVPILRRKRQANWTASRIDEVKIVYNVGYDASDVPAEGKLAILQTVADWFTYRNSVEIGTVVTLELPGSAKATLRNSGLVVPKV